MQWSDLPLNPTTRMLRQFAWLWILFFGAIAAWNWGVRDAEARTVLLTAALAAVGLVGVVAPSMLRPVFVGWIVLAFPIGWIVSRIALGLLFFGVMTPIALVFRLAGRDALQLARRPGPGSYWRPRTTRDDPGSYFRQF